MLIRILPRFKKMVHGVSLFFILDAMAGTTGKSVESIEAVQLQTVASVFRNNSTLKIL